MKITTKAAGIAGIVAVALPALAGAAGAATVGSGSTVNNNHHRCSISHAGTSNGQNLAFTAGHCFQEGDVVYDQAGNRLGTVVYSSGGSDGGGADYAVIKLDQGVNVYNPGVRAVANPVNPNGLNYANFGRVVTKTGSTSGTTYGVALTGIDRKTYSLLYSDRGDSGGVVRDINGEHVGTVSGGPGGVYFNVLTTTSNSANDINEYNQATGSNYVMQGTDGTPTEYASDPRIPGVDQSFLVNGAIGLFLPPVPRNDPTVAPITSDAPNIMLSDEAYFRDVAGGVTGTPVVPAVPEQVPYSNVINETVDTAVNDAVNNANPQVDFVVNTATDVAEQGFTPDAVWNAVDAVSAQSGANAEVNTVANHLKQGLAVAP